MPDSKTLSRFEEMFLPHMDAAYNLARMLTRSPQDAEDVVQEAYLRALRFAGTFRGGDENCRPWLLAIVRNTCYSWLSQNRTLSRSAPLDENVHVGSGPTPEGEAVRSQRAASIERCIQQLPEEFREAVVLRELEELPYRDIARITGVPVGTVMSRLSRARIRLTRCLGGIHAV